MNDTTSKKRILIHREGEEGGFEIELQGNGKTAKVATPPNELPDWAINEQIVSADMGERKEFYERRVGAEGYTDILGKEEAIQFQDLKWTAVDNEGDLVIIEPNHSWRLENLADILGLDTSAESFDTMDHDAMVVADYLANPTDEQTLAEAEQQSFGEVERQTANG